MSINQKIFLKINTLQKRNSSIDAVINFFAQYYLFVHGAIALYIMSSNWEMFGQRWFIVTALTLGFAIMLSYLTGVLHKHPRPIVTFPNIHQLFKPMETWKSFPSDHTIMSLSFFWPLLVLPVSIGSMMFFLCGGVLIGASRVFGGVHYPADIVGGIIYSGVTCYIVIILIRYLNLFIV